MCGRPDAYKAVNEELEVSGDGFGSSLSMDSVGVVASIAGCACF